MRLTAVTIKKTKKHVYTNKSYIINNNQNYYAKRYIKGYSSTYHVYMYIITFIMPEGSGEAAS